MLVTVEILRYETLFLEEKANRHKPLTFYHPMKLLLVKSKQSNFNISVQLLYLLPVALLSF